MPPGLDPADSLESPVMREARPFSFFGTRTSHELSFLRYTTRRAFTPQAWPGVVGKRSCENGIRISTLQPSAVLRHRRLPHRVPEVVLEVVVVDRRVSLDAGGAHLQDDARCAGRGAGRGRA